MSKINSTVDFAVKNGYIEDSHRKALSKEELQTVTTTLASMYVSVNQQLNDMLVKDPVGNPKYDSLAEYHAQIRANYRSFRNASLWNRLKMVFNNEDFLNN